MPPPCSTRPAPSRRSSSRCARASSGRCCSRTSNPGRVRGLVAIAPGVHPLAPQPDPIDPVDAPQWQGDFDGWIDYHTGGCSRAAFVEAVRGSRRVDRADRRGDADRAHARTAAADRGSEALTLSQALGCPVLVIHGTDDHCQPLERGRRFAAATGGRLIVLDGAGHMPHGRHPVLVNVVIKEFVDMHTTAAPPRSTWLFARERKRRALWVSSPIGLGHVLRDIAIARALRETSATSRSTGWPSRRSPPCSRPRARSCTRPAPSCRPRPRTGRARRPQHDLHAFYAFRRMDEILCANYMLFDDVVRETSYDLWIGDESWEVDHFLHENPERKIAPYAFLTDVIGFLPVDPRRSPRGRALRRLQRRDDRAPCAVPVRPRPVGVHRRLRRAAGRLVRCRAAEHPRLGASSGTPPCRTSSRSTPRRTGARPRCAAGSATAPAIRSTSRRSAGRRSAATCSS